MEKEWKKSGLEVLDATQTPGATSDSSAMCGWKSLNRWMNRCMEWGNALKHLGLPWGGAGLTTQAPESWEIGVTGEGVGLGWWPVAQKTPSFWFFWGRQAACALQPVRACWWGPTLQPLYNDNTLTFLRTYRLRIYHKLTRRKLMLFPLTLMVWLIFITKPSRSDQ